MKRPSLANILTVGLGCLVIATGVVGAYLGMIAAVIGLAGLLTSRALAHRKEVRDWSMTPGRSARPEAFGPVHSLTQTIRDAASGEEYSRIEVANLTSWLAGTKNGIFDSPGPKPITTTRRVLLAGAKDSGLGAPQRRNRVSGVKGTTYLAELQRELESTGHG